MIKEEDTAAITKVLTGHDNLNKHAHRAKLAENPHCEYWEEPDKQEKALHISTNCIAFSKLIYDTFGQSSYIQKPNQNRNNR